MKHKKNLATISILVVVALVLFVGFLIYYLRSNKSFRSLPLGSTGAVLEELSVEDERRLMSFNDLIDKTPVKMSGFRVEFSFKKDAFLVYLQKPYEVNKKGFYSWLADEGFGEIEREAFEFYLE